MVMDQAVHEAARKVPRLAAGWPGLDRLFLIIVRVGLENGHVGRGQEPGRHLRQRGERRERAVVDVGGGRRPPRKRLLGLPLALRSGDVR
jgi:hypothetical protein